MKTSPKEFVLGFLAIGGSVAAFWLWHRAAAALASGEFGGATIFIFPAITLLLAAAFFGLSSLFIQNARVAYGVAAVSVGAAYFFLDATGMVLLAALASILMAVWAARRIRKEYRFSLGFSIGKLFNSGLPAYFTAFSIAVSVFYFSMLNEERAFAALLPRQALEFTLENFSGPLEYLVGFSLLHPEATVNEVWEELALQQLEERGISSSNLAPSEIQRLTDLQRDGLESQFGVALRGDEKIGDVLSHIIAERIRDLLGPYAAYLPAAAAIAFFLAFKTFTWPLYYVTLVIVWVIIKFMAAAKILVSEKKQIEITRLTL